MQNLLFGASHFQKHVLSGHFNGNIIPTFIQHRNSPGENVRRPVKLMSCLGEIYLYKLSSILFVSATFLQSVCARDKTVGIEFCTEDILGGTIIRTPAPVSI